jgi:outer membrane protein TolC
MKNNLILFILVILIGNTHIYAQEDSLQNYMMAAARNNQTVLANYTAYLAALQRIAPAGTLNDPELSIGFFLKPMEQVNGKEVGTVSLMQMFPWFGTLKAAKSEMTWMAEATYQNFRESGLDVIYQVQVQWYQLASARARIKYLKRNIELLKSLEEVVLYKYKSPSLSGAGSSINTSASTKMDNISSSPSSGGMSGMGSVGSNKFVPQPSSAASMPSSGMSSGMNSGGGNMSDMLRLQIEEAGLQEQVESLESQYKLSEATFNSLLHRDVKFKVVVPDTLVQKVLFTDADSWKAVVDMNPMLAMWKAEGQSYVAKEEMSRKMGYPMIGVGVEYMINKKKDETTTSSDGMTTTASSMNKMNGMNMVMPMIKFSLPIYRRKYKATVQEAKLMKRSADLNYGNTTDQLQIQYLSIIQRAEDASRKIALYEKQIRLSNTTLHLLLREYATSRASLTDILQFERELIDYEFKKFEMLSTYNIVSAEYDKLMSKNDFMNIK